MTKLLLSVEEAGAVLGVRRTTVYDLIGKGELESVKIGKLRKVPSDALQAYVERVREEAREPVAS